ncbi:MAG: hypothetical protein IRY98_09030, partial [Alicyclobacillaceae bacterium]|nr:hypothetical protein [Alicyclobacillaceae bacterium]
GALILYNRRGRDRTAHYPELAALFQDVGAEDFLLDGELVAPDPEGRPDFLSVIRRDLSNSETSRRLATRIPVQYVPFDVLRWNGRWLLNEPLEHRLDYLQNIKNSLVCAPAMAWKGQEEALWDQVVRLNLEGLVAKRSGSRYLPGHKSPLWRKMKHRRKLVALVGGAVFRRGRFKSLCLGLMEPDGLRYIGNVGSGVPDAAERVISDWSTHLTRPSSPFKDLLVMEGVTWWDPAVAAEVEYAEWTPAGHLRQPSLKRMWWDGKEVQEEVKRG